MKCPFCQGEMTAGHVQIGRTTLGTLTDLVMGDLGGMPHYLHFYAHDGGDAMCLDHAREAFRCSACEAFILAGTKEMPRPAHKQPAAAGTDICCPACGAAVNEHQTRCPECDIALT